MSYSNSGLRCMVPRMGGGPAVWHYSSTDVHTDVDAAGYFSDGVTFGLKVGDIVFVVDTDTGPYNATLHAVASVSGDAATISAAILA